MSNKEEFFKGFRTIRARDYEFSKEEMRSCRIRRIYNSIGQIHMMNDDYIEKYTNSLYRPEHGEVAVVETSIKQYGSESCNPLKVVSVIVFSDVWSWHVYAIKNINIYSNIKFYNNLQSLLN